MSISRIAKISMETAVFKINKKVDDQIDSWKRQRSAESPRSPWIWAKAWKLLFLIQISGDLYSLLIKLEVDDKVLLILDSVHIMYILYSQIFLHFHLDLYERRGEYLSKISLTADLFPITGNCIFIHSCMKDEHCR